MATCYEPKHLVAILRNSARVLAASRLTLEAKCDRAIERLQGVAVKLGSAITLPGPVDHRAMA